MKLTALVKVLPQYLLPHHLLSAWMAKFTYATNTLWKNLFIKLVIKLYRVNVDEAKYTELDHYPHFNAFFTRELKAGVRSFPTAADEIACPADGAISQIGYLDDLQVLQAKGRCYSVADLLGGENEWTANFVNGAFATIYLSPKDYHRLHMPVDGSLRTMIHVPGRLFSVNPTTTDLVPNLFARNERVVCLFDTPAGPMAIVLVGAIFVNSIETVWHGVITPPTRSTVTHWQYLERPVSLQRGMELGRFNMGSTVIILFAKDSTLWQNSLVPGSSVKLGQILGKSSR